MEIPMFATPGLCEDKGNTFCYNDPSAIYTDEDEQVAPLIVTDRSSLAESLRKYGPIVASIHLTISAEKNDFLCEDKLSTPKNVVILGIKEAQHYPLIIFRFVEDITGDTPSKIRKYQPNSAYEKTYAIAFTHFQSTVVKLHPVCPYANWLFDLLPTFSILKENNAKVNKVGQAIFDHYYKLGNPGQAINFPLGSAKARHATLRIWRACKIFSVIDGNQKEQEIKEAFSGIGDSNGKWDVEEEKYASETEPFNSREVKCFDKNGAVTHLYQFPLNKQQTE